MSQPTPPRPPGAPVPNVPPPPGQPPASPMMPPSGPADQASTDQPSTGRMVAIVAAVVAAALGLAGVIFALTRNDDPAVTTDATGPATTVEALPVDTVTSTPEPATTEQPTTEPAVTAPAETQPPTTPAPPTTLDETVGLTSIPQLLTWTSFSEEPLDDAEQQASIEALLIDQTVQAVAHPTKVSTICAGIPVEASLDLTVTWQYLGDTVQSDVRAATPPGTGSCIDNGGEPLGAGTYQVFAATSDLSEVGYATTFVVGATQISQRFVNNSDVDICDIGVGPLDAQFYELFVSSGGPMPPGDLIDIDIASVEQDLRATACDGTDLEALVFTPNSFAEQNLVP